MGWAIQQPPTSPTHFAEAVQENLCPRCNSAEETTFHQLWSCPANIGIEGAHLEHLGRAAREHQTYPGFWLRGLPPLEWTYQHSMLGIQGELHYEGCRPSQPIPLPTGAVIGTDGSGGHTAPTPEYDAADGRL